LEGGVTAYQVEHTLILHRVKTFAKAEKLDLEPTNKLVKIAEEQWQRIIQEAKKDGATQPKDLGTRCKRSLPVSSSGRRKS
jgi:hypothetical protein